MNKAERLKALYAAKSVPELHAALGVEATGDWVRVALESAYELGRRAGYDNGWDDGADCGQSES